MAINLEIVACVLCEFPRCDSVAQLKQSLSLAPNEFFAAEAERAFKGLGWQFDGRDRWYCQKHAQAPLPSRLVG